jgi:hypothetical protein
MSMELALEREITQGPAVPAQWPARPRWGRGAQAAMWAAAGVAGAIGGLMLRAGIPIFAGLPPCALRETLHVGCATCGFTRALTALAQGDLAASLALHPLVLPIVVEVAVAWALWGAGLWRGAALIRARWLARAAAATAVAGALIWLVRLATGTLPA